ncbi:MAG: hypothetical protein CVT59_07410 [Actinobacteria bacterium HGW-Actinobacteria-1]|nr:MAG: hypothetical protein CVT59_07410 [Actinobacteria bacterium HGW-Actinobacteria-1]
MRRSQYIRFAAAVAAFTLAIGLVSPAPAVADMAPLSIPEFTITGGGFGHGIGLSQYGAQGYALQGWKYDAIIKHYYQGTSISAMAHTVQPRVNLNASGTARSTWTLRAVDTTLTLYATTNPTVKVYLPKNIYYTVSNTSSGVVVKDQNQIVKATFPGGNVIADPNGNALVDIRDTSGPMSYPYVRWRGYVELVRNGTTTLYLYNVVGFQDYLYGVVPRESPASWNAEALKAQAVVARSYAKKKLDPNDDGVRDNSLLCTTADQVYGGHSKLVQGEVDMHEDSRTNSAVDLTNNLIVKSGTSIVQTFFFSASGGHTANIEDSWSYSDPQVYYTGVDDPYEAAAGSPYSSWTPIKKTGLELAVALRDSSTARSELSNHGLPAVPTATGVYVTGVTIDRGESGYPRWTYFHFSDAAKTVCKLSGYTVKVALGLKSPNFNFSGFPMSRIQGADRYATAIAISQKAFTGTAPAVVLASGEAYPDALCGSALAGAEDGSLLLTAKASLPSAVETELKRLAPARVYIMGSTAAISADVEARVRTVLPSAVTTRLAGTDRYETSRKVADKVYALKAPTKAVVANAFAWPDAASVSALAYAKHYPILFSRPSELGTDTAGYLSAHKPTGLVVGSETVVPASVFTEVQTLTAKTPTRLAGANRYATAAAVARYSLNALEGFSSSEVYITTGLNYPDALAGGVIAGKGLHPLVLTGFDSVPPDTATFLKEKQPTIGYIWILGGAGAISKTGAGAIDSVMMN